MAFEQLRILLLGLYLYNTKIILCNNITPFQQDISELQNLSEDGEEASDSAEYPPSGEDNFPNQRRFSLTTDPDDVKFFLYSDPDNPEAEYELFLNDRARLKMAGFRRGAQVIFITHGFMSSYNATDTLGPLVKDAYLSQKVINVIAVDWSVLAKAPLPDPLLSYYAVVKRTLVVGNRVADFIQFLKKEKIIKSPCDVHLIGHSLGAHVSGIAGNAILNRTGKLIDRITGLDPAGPLYNFFQNDMKIDPSDAKFVDILHTAVGSLGSGDLHGHVDFFASGGRVTSQSGCFNYTSNPIHFITDVGYAPIPEPIKCMLDPFAKSNLSSLVAAVQQYNIGPNECPQEGPICNEMTLFGEHVPRTARDSFYIDVSKVYPGSSIPVPPGFG